MFSLCTTYYLVFALCAYISYKVVQRILMQRKLARWSNTPKDVLIVHGVPAGLTIPNASPFVLKLETYLRMANIKYEYDSKDAFGPKGKTPWITLNGEHVADSQLIIDFLEKKFDINLNGNYSEEQLAVSTLARVTLEEHFFWGATLWAFVYDSAHHVYNVLNIRPKFFIPLFIGRAIKKITWAQGLGRHSQADVEKLTTRDFTAISKILGKKKYFLGNEPCADDASIFGFLAQTQWGLLIGSPYQKLTNGELHNIKEYCIRMRDKYWPDFDSKCHSSKSK